MVLNHAAVVESNSTMFLSLFRADSRYTPVKIDTLNIVHDSMTSFGDGYRNYSRVIRAKVPSDLEGSFMLSTSALDSAGRQRLCSEGHTVLISIVPSRDSKKDSPEYENAIAFHPKLDVLYPQDGSIFHSSINKLDVHVAMQVQNDVELDVCIIMKKVGEDSVLNKLCQSANTPQPFSLLVCIDRAAAATNCDSSGPHALLVMIRDKKNASRQIASQTVVFDMITEPTNYHLNLLTPKENGIMWDDSAWLRVQILPYLPYNSRVCALLDKTYKFCGLDPLQPHQLVDIRPGEHNISVWLENEEMQTSSKPKKVTHTFLIQTKLDIAKTILSPLVTSAKTVLSSIRESTSQLNSHLYCIIVFAFVRPLHLSLLWDSLLEERL